MRTALLISTLLFTLLLASIPASRANSESGDEANVAQWITELEGGKPSERWNAAYQLGKCGERAAPATDALISSLGDDDIRVVWYAIHTLGSIGEKAATAVPALREALSVQNDQKEETKPKYVATTALGDKYTRRFAAVALGRIGRADAAAPDLRRAMVADDASLNVAAALALWQVAEDAAAVDVLGKMLVADDVNAAHEAALAFTLLGSAGRPGIPALANALKSGTEDVRRSAARALGQMGPVATPALAEALASENAVVRRAAAQGFDWLGQAARDKVMLNPKTLRKTFDKVYSHLDSKAVAALRIALDDDDADVRRLAADAIGSIGPVAIPALMEAIQDTSDALRDSAATALERIEARTSLADIVPEFADSFREASAKSISEAIRSDDPFVRLYGVRMFVFLGVARLLPDTRPQLVRLLEDDNVQVRRYASAALRQF